MKAQDKTVRYYLTSDEVDHHEILKKGLDWLLDSNIASLILYIPTLERLEGTYLNTVIGNKAAKELGRNWEIPFRNRTISLITSENMKQINGQVRLFAVWPDSEILYKIENKYSALTILVIPWNPVEIEEWKNDFNPIDILLN